MTSYQFVDKDNEVVTIDERAITYKNATISLLEEYYVLITSLEGVDHSLVEICDASSPIFSVMTSNRTAKFLSKDWSRCKAYVAA